MERIKIRVNILRLDAMEKYEYKLANFRNFHRYLETEEGTEKTVSTVWRILIFLRRGFCKLIFEKFYFLILT